MTERIDIWPGVEKTPGVVGGDACIRRIRIPVWGANGLSAIRLE